MGDFTAALREAFYLDEDTIRDAVRRRTSFNLIHLRTFLEVDVFVAKDDEASRAQMERRRPYEIEGEQRGVLDRRYLRSASALLGVEDLLDHALDEAGLGGERRDLE